MDKFNLTEGQLKDNEKVNLFSYISQSLFRELTPLLTNTDS
jgi:hypothetical protein